MDKNLSLNSSTLTNDTINTTSKLRRLRIEEAHILQSIIKLGGRRNIHEDIEIDDSDINSLDYIQFLKKTRDSHINLKNLYDEVKTKTNSQELLAELDIEDMKKKVFELETSIKTMKSDISFELAALKLSEQELNKQIAEKPNNIERIIRHPNSQSANKYNAIVPSPVRVMISSPFKCSEVQQFQEFMKSSPNRYGGWNEYNHNIFVMYWQKHFGKNSEVEVEDMNTLSIFIEEVMPKLQGIQNSDITSHVKWYKKYLYLKEQQQNAINKWKGNKISVKNITKKVKYADQDVFPLETNLDDCNFIACNFKASQDDQSEAKCTLQKASKSKSFELRRGLQEKQRPSSLRKPTKQWINRIHQKDVGLPPDSITMIEHATKQLRTPIWRLGL